MNWKPAYSPWRHGGWYVHNVRYPSGAVGCVSRNYVDRKWRIVDDNRPGSYPGGPNDHTYPNRDSAAYAEKEIADARCNEAPKCPKCGNAYDKRDEGCWRRDCQQRG